MFNNGWLITLLTIIIVVIIIKVIFGMLRMKHIIARIKKNKAVREGRGGIAVVVDNEFSYEATNANDRYVKWYVPIYVCALDNGEVFRYGESETEFPPAIGEVYRIVKISNKHISQISRRDRIKGNGIIFEEDIFPSSYEGTPNWQTIQRFIEKQDSQYDALLEQDSEYDALLEQDSEYDDVPEQDFDYATLKDVLSPPHDVSQYGSYLQSRL